MPITTREGLLEEWYNKMYLLRCYFAGETPLSPIPLPDVTTVDGMLEGIANEADGSLIALAKSAGIYHDYDEAYTLQFPSKLYRWYGVKKIGGRTLVYNQVAGLTASTSTVKGVTLTYNADGITTTSGKATEDIDTSKQPSYTFISNHWYMIKGAPPGASIDTYYCNMNEGRILEDGLVFKSASTTKKYLHFVIKAGIDVTGLTWKLQIFDLTVMFGAGNEPKTAAEFNAIFPSDYYAQNSGELINAGVTDVVSKDADNNVLETITIPSAVKSLTGYGMSCPNNVNYIDFEEKKFVQSVGFVDLSTLTWGYGPSVGWSATLSNVKNPADDDTAFNGLSATLKVTDRNTQATAFSGGTDAGMVSVAGGKVYVGTGSISIVPSGTLIYELDKPVETDVSAYLTDVDLNVEAGGTITFENQTDCNIPVPVDVRYIG